MQSSRNRSFVLTLATAGDGGELFAGDLYVGCSLRTSVQQSRSAMLDWLESVDAEARQAAARAMDQLASCSTPLRIVPLSMLPIALDAWMP